MIDLKELKFWTSQSAEYEEREKLQKPLADLIYQASNLLSCIL